MKKLNLLLIILSIAVASVWSQPVSSPEDSWILIINAYSRDIFIRITDTQNDVIYQTEALPPNNTSNLLSTPETGYYFIDYKYGEADDWRPFTDSSYDEGDEDYLINLQAGLVCCIVINSSGQIDEHTLVLPDSDLPLVCFCNISNTTLNRMEIGTDYMNEFVAFTSDITAMGLTDFTAIDPGNYGLFWESVASGEKDEFTWLPNDDDSLRLIPFENNSQYIFCVFNNDARSATLFNITQ